MLTLWRSPQTEAATADWIQAHKGPDSRCPLNVGMSNAGQLLHLFNSTSLSQDTPPTIYPDCKVVGQVNTQDALVYLALAGIGITSEGKAFAAAHALEPTARALTQYAADHGASKLTLTAAAKAPAPAPVI